MTTPSQQLGEQIATIEARLKELAAVQAALGTKVEDIASDQALIYDMLRPDKPEPDPDPPVTEPDPPAIDDPRIDISPLTGTHTVGDTISVPVVRIADSQPLSWHVFDREWKILHRETVTVSNGQVTVTIPDNPGDAILQLQYGNTAKEHALATIVAAETPTVPAIPVDPPPTSNYTPPSLPKATKEIRLEPGVHNIKDIIQGGQDKVNHIIGSRDAIVTDLGYIGSSSFIFEGVSLRCNGNYKKATFVESSRGVDSQCWFIDIDLVGRNNSDRSGLDTAMPVFGFDRHWIIDSTIRRVRRGVNGNGWAAAINSRFEDILEDLWQQGGVIRNVIARGVGKLHLIDENTHPDILQFPGPIDADGLNVTDYVGQGFALGGTTASGSRLRNINITGRADTARMIGNGAMIENADGKGGPSDLLFENVVCDKPFIVRTNDTSRPERNWAGSNIRAINCKFSNREGDWSL